MFTASIVLQLFLSYNSHDLYDAVQGAMTVHDGNCARNFLNLKDFWCSPCKKCPANAMDKHGPFCSVDTWTQNSVIFRENKTRIWLMIEIEINQLEKNKNDIKFNKLCMMIDQI